MSVALTNTQPMQIFNPVSNSMVNEKWKNIIADNSSACRDAKKLNPAFVNRLRKAFGTSEINFQLVDLNVAIAKKMALDSVSSPKQKKALREAVAKTVQASANVQKAYREEKTCDLVSSSIALLNEYEKLKTAVESVGKKFWVINASEINKNIPISGTI